MKKGLSIFLFAFIFLSSLFFPTSANAVCSPPPNTLGQCARGLIHCDLPNGSVQCCDQPAGGCSQIPGSTQLTVPPDGVAPSDYGLPSNSNTTDIQGDCKSNTEIDTAIGCIPALTNDGGTALMGFILKWAVGVGGGIAFLLILYAGFMIMTAAGNPERLKAGQELMTSAISGLVLLIFSIFVLKFIGLDILGLGAFGFGK
jgi:hypothetical protein